MMKMIDMIVSVAETKPKVKEGMEKLAKELDTSNRDLPSRYAEMLNRVSQFDQ